MTAMTQPTASGKTESKGPSQTPIRLGVDTDSPSGGVDVKFTQLAAHPSRMK